MGIKKFSPTTPLVKYQADKLIFDAKGKRPAVFFEVDGVLRFFRPDVFDRYKADAEKRGIAPPPGPMKPYEQALHPEAIAFLKEKQSEGYLLIGLTMQEHVEYIAHHEGLKLGENALQTMAAVQAETIDMCRDHNLFLTEIAHCPHYMGRREIMGPDPLDPKKEVLVEVKHYVRCECHFPKRGLIETAIEKYDIDVPNSMMIYVKDEAKLAAVNEEWIARGLFVIPKLWHTNNIINGWWRNEQKATELERKAAEALKKDIKAGSAGQFEAMANSEFGAVAHDKALEEAMPNYTRVLHEEGLLENKE